LRGSYLFVFIRITVIVVVVVVTVLWQPKLNIGIRENGLHVFYVSCCEFDTITVAFYTIEFADIYAFVYLRIFSSSMIDPLVTKSATCFHGINWAQYTGDLPVWRGSTSIFRIYRASVVQYYRIDWIGRKQNTWPVFQAFQWVCQQKAEEIAAE
jgi:hypothetical protein